VQVAEIVFVFLLAFAVVAVGWRLVGDALFARQAVVWVANVLMLAAIWIGLRLRGQTWEHFGLSFHFGGRRAAVHTVLQSLVILVVALVAFVAGSVLALNVAAAPESADMSGYDYLRGNLPMLLLALTAVYVASSFGEEVI
jgi:small-conductance mechanosensitive channel